MKRGNAKQKCPKCKGELKIGHEQVGVNSNNLPIYHNFGYCYNCKLKWDLDEMNNQQSVKKMNRAGCLTVVLAFVFLFVLISVTSAIFKKDDDSNIPEQDTIIDATQFANASTEELKRIMGEPSTIEESTQEIGEYTFPIQRYSYNDGLYEFLIIENKVVRLTVNSPYYWTGEGDYFYYDSNNPDTVFDPFGITPSDNMVHIANTGYALRYQLVTDNIDEFYVTECNTEENTFGSARITYDQLYFGDLAVPSLERFNLEDQCEEFVKSILQSPSTAKFPSDSEWNIYDNINGTIIQAYVDAQNGFGAELRSEFQIIINNGTITSFIFDGQELITQ